MLTFEEERSDDTGQAAPGAVITAVGGEGALRCRLLDMGLIPKTRVRVEKVAPLGDPLELRVRGYSLSLRKEDAGKIEVEVAGT
jgi:ferrous iron transport protein A